MIQERVFDVSSAVYINLGGFVVWDEVEITKLALFIDMFGITCCMQLPH